LLALPAVGTLNAHPAILPDYRGIDCTKWALVNDDLDKIGSTVHWVDSGVDTGNVIAKLRYAVTVKDTVERIDEVLSRQCANEMACVVRRLLDGEKLPGECQSAEEGKQYRKMSWRQEKSAKVILAKLIRQMV
jgi:methionyl-tRNA formyltransferase